MEEIMTEENNSVFHYTNEKGLEGILSSQCLWATYYKHLNDSSEFKLQNEVLKKYFLPLLGKIIEEKYRLLKYKLNIEELAETCIENIRKAAFGFENVVIPYVTSFCIHEQNSFHYKNGLLSQWRSYGDDGFALEFDRDIISKMCEQLNQNKECTKEAYFDEVYYYEPNAETEKNDKIIKQLNNDINTMNDCLSKFCIYDIENNFFKFKTKKPSFPDDFLGHYLKLACSLKHIAFEEEKEIRIICFPTKDFHSYSQKKHIELFKKQGNLHIKRIIIGPCENQEKKREGITQILKKNSLSNIEIILSETPYIKTKKNQ